MKTNIKIYNETIYIKTNIKIYSETKYLKTNIKMYNEIKYIISCSPQSANISTMLQTEKQIHQKYELFIAISITGRRAASA